MNKSWLNVVVWSLTLGRLEEKINIEHWKIYRDYPNISDALDATSKISHDESLFFAILAICKTIEQSTIEKKIDVIQAFTLLEKLDELSANKLPDLQNIKHEGYLIACQAIIHGARSVAYKAVSKKRNLSKIAIRKKWGELETSARKMSNLADRVFVMYQIAKEYFKYDEEKAIELLEETENLIEKIPAIVDKLDRLEDIGKTWGEFGKKDIAQFTLEKVMDLTEQLSDYSRDKKLELLVQAAYELNPDFAEELASRYDSRFPDKVFNPLMIPKEMKKLIANPECVLSKKGENPFLPFVMGNSAWNLRNDLIIGNGIVPRIDVNLEWVKLCEQYDEETFFEVINWVQECINRWIPPYPSIELSPIFINLASLISKLASFISPARQAGLSEEIIRTLPGLSSKVTVFRSGDMEKAKKWVKEWLQKNTEDYLKIVDPYFGPDQITYFSDLPKNIKILIVTTNHFFMDFQSSERIKAHLNYIWDKYGKGKKPLMSIIIVPEKNSDAFHDRVIITKRKGLDLGQSLNGLGMKTGKITDLPNEDAKELETKYVDTMLNNNSWFIDKNVQPIVISLGYSY